MARSDGGRSEDDDGMMAGGAMMLLVVNEVSVAIVIGIGEGE